MPKRLVSLFALAVTATALLGALFAGSASAAQSPWWQVLDGSRPSHLWEANDNMQEVETEKLFGLIFAAKVEVNGKAVGCLGAGEVPEFSLTANALCEEKTGFPASETAAEVEAMLEGPYGPTVEVSGGPVGGAPLEVRVPGSGAAPIELDLIVFGPFKLGTASVKVLSPGGSGRLLVTVTNLGDAPVDGTEVPVTIQDELPEGAIATSAKASAGVNTRQGPAFGPLDCAVKASDEVLCSFEGTLPPYESIELEVLTSLQGSPPLQGEPGKITVSGGNAPSASREQKIIVSPDPVPYGVERFSAQAEEEGGGLARQAGGHPFQFTTTVQ